MPNRLFGLGPIPTDQSFTGSTPLVVRQAAALIVGCFVHLVMVGMTIGVLLKPGDTVHSGNAFIDRWFFGVVVVPALYASDRFLIRPRVRVDAEGVELHNPMQTIVAKWPAVVGAGFDTHLRVITADGETVRSVLFGPGLSSPLTSSTRVEQLMDVINSESARRMGKRYDPEALYSAEALIGAGGEPAPPPSGPGAQLRHAWGLLELAAYAAAWTLACLYGAKMFS